MSGGQTNPREPTPEMVNAGKFAVLTAAPLADLVLQVWQAMHDAAPSVEAEPVAWALFTNKPKSPRIRTLSADPPSAECLEIAQIEGETWAPLYTHPAAPQLAALPELSDAEILSLRAPAVSMVDFGIHCVSDDETVRFARAVIAALKGKQ